MELAQIYKNVRKARPNMTAENALKFAKIKKEENGYFYHSGKGYVYRDVGTGYYSFENPEKYGLRFVGYSDNIVSYISHTGWYCQESDPEWGSSLRGVVYQLTGKNGKTRLVAGYATQEEMHREHHEPDYVTLDVTSMETRDLNELILSSYSLKECDLGDLACYADSLAENEAEHQRNYNHNYDIGRKFSENIQEIKDIKEEVKALLSERKTLRHLENKNPNICQALKNTVTRCLSKIAELKEENEEIETMAWITIAFDNGKQDG